MVIREDFMLEQIRRFVERLAGVRKHISENKKVAAAEGLGELLRDMDVAWDDADDEARRRLGPVMAQALAEMGALDASTGAHEDARRHLERALDLLTPEEGRLDPKNLRLYATLLLNSGALLASERQYDPAMATFGRLIEFVESRSDWSDPPHPLGHLWAAAHQNRATIAEQRASPALAENDHRRALAYWDATVGAGHLDALSDVVDGRLRLAALVHRSRGVEAALPEAQQALIAAERMVHEGIGAYPVVFVRAKMAMAQLSFSGGRLSAGEDHLFQAIDAIPELEDTVLLGLDLYAELLGRDDEALESGGLPRDEVEDSYAELLAQLDTRSADETLKKLARARYDLLVNGRTEPARTLLDALAEPLADRRAQSMRDTLEGELDRSG